MDLFEQKIYSEEKKFSPLADRMRPKDLSEFVGQEHILGKGKFLRKAIENDQLTSVILWGPPGSGKTTLACVIANMTRANFVSFSAVSSGIKEVRAVMEEAKNQLKFYNKKTILFIDEIHRFNKVQQDAFLPYVEDGTIILIGATTENPSFEVNSPLLSRSKVFVLNPLTKDEIKTILKKAITDEKKGLGKFKLKIDKKAADHLVESSNGDARIALNTLEMAVLATNQNKSGIRDITLNTVEQVLQHKALIFDKDGEEHYNVISAFIKSLRNSDPNAALYWLARMVEAGENPRFIARRMIVLASEDIGNADPLALCVATATAHAVEYVGMPEAQINLAQAATYLAHAEKSNASYKGLLAAREDVKQKGNLPVPKHLRNPVTSLMKKLGYGKGYKYAHNFKENKTDMKCLPDELKGRKYYKPEKY